MAGTSPSRSRSRSRSRVSSSRSSRRSSSSQSSRRRCSSRPSPSSCLKTPEPFPSRQPTEAHTPLPQNFVERLLAGHPASAKRQRRSVALVAPAVKRRFNLTPKPKEMHVLARPRSDGFDLDKPERTEKKTIYELMARLPHTRSGQRPQEMGISCTVKVEGGLQSLTCTAADRDGVFYAWSGKEFRGEIFERRVLAENSAASLFINDPDVRATAADVEPSNTMIRQQEKRLNWMRRDNLMRLGFGKSNGTNC
ncbi:unnamed protein product [Effrenium voratum]|uniref:Uncharacterized protein n=1 Tax=Effrenium voratum TaxID=2562239 RepID=A0AA36MU05_9DINO|nr:unnamed protein product [Effrenium voratum]